MPGRPYEPDLFSKPAQAVPDELVFRHDAQAMWRSCALIGRLVALLERKHESQAP
jgi:hypothetical protein